MKDHDAERHPGPWRVMRVDAEVAGILVALGFVVMGVVSMPLATWFFLGAAALGVIVALLLRFAPRKFRLIGRLTIGAFIILGAFSLWQARHIPRRPQTVSSNAVYVSSNNASGFSHPGYWLECWFDQHENADRCRLTDKHGNGVFEDVFVTCGSQATIPQSELVIQPETGRRWIQSHDARMVNVPVPYVRYGQILFPRSLYAEAQHQGYCYGT